MLRSLFLDFNAYFASCEQHFQPHLRGKPIAVCPVDAATGCCIAASYEAKAFGIKTGTRVAEARKLCPGIIIVQAHPKAYVELHHRLISLIEDCMHIEKVWSIDEMHCPLTGHWREEKHSRALAHTIKTTIAREVGPAMRCSIGIAPNNYIAKIASDMVKPDGLTVIHEAELPEALHPLDLNDLPGIGKRMRIRLERAGIRTMPQLCRAPRPQLRRIWGGVKGERFWFQLRGHPIPLPETQRRTVGHSHVLPPALRDQEKIRPVLLRLLQKAAMRLRALDYAATRLSVRVDFGEACWEDEYADAPTDSTRELILRFNQLWDQKPPTPHPRTVYVTLSGLVHQSALSLPLLDHIPTNRSPLDKAIDAINLKHGSRTVFYAGAMEAIEAAPMRIAFTQIPNIDRESDD